MRRRALVLAATAARAEAVRAALVGPTLDVVVVDRERLGGAMLDAAATGQSFAVLVLDRAAPLPPTHVPTEVVLVDAGDAAELAGLAARIDEVLAAAPPATAPLPPSAIDLSRPFRDLKRDAVQSFERTYLSALVAAHRGNLTQAARQAGMDRKNLWRLLGKYKLLRPLPERRTQRRTDAGTGTPLRR